MPFLRLFRPGYGPARGLGSPRAFPDAVVAAPPFVGSTLPAWPVTVPAIARDGWQMPSMYLPPLATEMDGGNQRLRAMPGNNVASISYPLQPLTDAEWADFETFVRTTLNNGASRWTMTLLIGPTMVSKTVQFDQGKSPTVTRHGGFMFVTLPLRVYGM